MNLDTNIIKQNEEIIDALDKSQGVIEFNMEGTILNANNNFLKLIGYSLDEVIGKHHSLFCEKDYVDSEEYVDFWKKLNRGEFDSAQYKRIGKNGKEVYIQATYNPVSDSEGKLIKVIKLATNVTEQKLKNAEFEGKINAIDKSLGTIEFNMDGTVIDANETFLNVVDYSLEEIKGKHHSMLCDVAYVESPEYKKFWEQLNNGEFSSGEYKQVGKNGKKIYIQATYNPILDLNGNLIKVLKIASDVTEQKLKNAEFEGKIKAINKSLGTIEFNMDGTVIDANDKFLNVLGYSLNEIKGKHHSMFCETSFANSPEYRKFWELLNKGEFNTGEYKRIGKNGREAYIQATYNPIFDLSGKPVKVLKIASDVTEQKRRERENTKQAALIMDMSTPVMRLWDNILLLPIIGLVDSKRVQLIMETALQKISDYQAKIIILDIQGVPAIDSAVANHLIKVTKATKLMGCSCIVTGIFPEISQALVNLGIELGDIMTQSTLKEGVSASLEDVGLQLINSQNV
jgi:methyl-accepting chemotaxis protein